MFLGAVLAIETMWEPQSNLEKEVDPSVSVLQIVVGHRLLSIIWVS